jgi:immune inhibitor A
MKKTLIILIVIAVIACCCLAFILPLGGLVGYEMFSNKSAPVSITVTAAPFSPEATETDEAGEEVYETEAAPTESTSELNPEATPQAETSAASTGANETLKTLEDSEVPINDLRDLAERLKGIKNIPETVAGAPKNYNVGDSETFWVSEDDTHKEFQIKAVLRYKGDHLYFWVDEVSSYSQPELEQLAKTFDNKIYPTDREFFGSEWSPGIDNDPRLFLLYAHGVGDRVAGYFSSNDEYPLQAHKYSNQHEMFIINSDVTGLGEEYTYGVLAHEFQHMIHWYQDRNEASWVNEGFSELASFLNGYDVGSFDRGFMQNPDMQLNDWPNDPNATTPHYGSGFLFMNYFLNRFGDKATQKLVENKLNGMDSVETVLHDLNIKDSLSGDAIHADDVFVDWTITNFLNDPNVEDGRYQYNNYQAAPKAEASDVIDNCPADLSDQTVYQYGADYIEISCSGNYTLSFKGNAEEKLVPENAHSGKYMFWSNKGDESDMTLTHQFDLSQAKSRVELSYWTWYDLEEDFDYTYVEASEDGKSWTILSTPSGTGKDPSGNSYGWGYNGKTDKWKKEKLDLSQYAGKKVYIRFEYITDAAVNGEGFLLDDISIPAIDYSSDFETDNGGWEAAGFVRVQNLLPQTYSVSMIRMDNNNTAVKKIDLDASQSAKIPLQLNGWQKVVLVVSGTTRFTRSEAPYSITIDK